MKKLKFQVIKGDVLGVKVFRGFGRLCDLAKMSKPDIYDQKKNPTGTQRDLSPRHARDAYFYIKNNDLAFWPEVFLCIRNKNCYKFVPDTKESNVGDLIVDLDLIDRDSKISISRVDGNHRLHYADGKTKGFDEIDKSVSFCLAFAISLTEEIKLFRDINNNQKRMNTSHLDKIEIRLNPEEQLKRIDPDLFIAQRLSSDAKSPLHGRVYEGGVSIGPNAIPLRTLKTGIQYMRSRTIKLAALKDPEAQARVIMNYFDAVKKWIPDAWKQPKSYIVLRGVGLWGISFIGANVIDRVLAKGEFDTESMYKILKSGKKWDWSNKGEFEGFSGRGGAVKISEMVTSEFQEEGNMSPNELYRQIMQKKTP
jgi:DGQHR domain-containing protein